MPYVLRKLKMNGFLNIVVTNQPDIGNGLVDKEEVKKMHSYLLQMGLIRKIYMCPHKQIDNCECRKPRTGMFMRAKKELNVDFKRSWMIGDRFTDIQAAQSIGMLSVFIDRGYNESTGKIKDCYIVKNIMSCLEIIL